MYDTHRSLMGSCTLAFIAGAAAGAITAILTSPRTGRENREAIASSARDLSDRARDLGYRAKAQVSDVQQRVARAGRAVRAELTKDNGSPISEF